MESEKLESIHIDTKKGIYQLNGENIGDCVSELELRFEKGKWVLAIDKTLKYESQNCLSGVHVQERKRTKLRIEEDESTCSIFLNDTELTDVMNYKLEKSSASPLLNRAVLTVTMLVECTIG